MANTFADDDPAKPNPATLHKLNKEKSILIFDNIKSIGSQNIEEIPKRYRNGLNLTPKLHASASAQPNTTDLKYIINLAKIHLPKSSKSSQVFIIDLRQEPHVFLNNTAISWYGFRNQVSHQSETYLIEQLRIEKTAKVYKGIDKLQDGYFIPKGFSNIIIKQLQTEEQLVNQLGAQYLRVLVTDHHAPDSSQVDLFVEFIKKLPKNSWLHFHCRGGKGRSTTFMGMYDIILHHKSLTLEDILERQQALGGATLSKTKYLTERQKWKEPAIANRYEFIQAFYQYVLDPNGYSKNSWTTWNNMQNDK